MSVINNITIFTATGAATWTAPSDFVAGTLLAFAYGGGGKGAVASGAATGGGGGGACMYKLFSAASIVAGQTYSLSVGTGAVGATASAQSWLVNATTLMAPPGASSTSATGGAGGLATSGFGDAGFNGGTGGAGSTDGGGGGGGAGSTGNGNNGVSGGVNSRGGAAGLGIKGGNGGVGAQSEVNGGTGASPGLPYGGGGGGDDATGLGPGNGGAGGVILFYATGTSGSSGDPVAQAISALTIAATSSFISSSNIVMSSSNSVLAIQVAAPSDADVTFEVWGLNKSGGTAIQLAANQAIVNAAIGSAHRGSVVDSFLSVLRNTTIAFRIPLPGPMYAYFIKAKHNNADNVARNVVIDGNI